AQQLPAGISTLGRRPLERQPPMRPTGPGTKSERCTSRCEGCFSSVFPPESPEPMREYALSGSATRCRDRSGCEWAHHRVASQQHRAVWAFGGSHKEQETPQLPVHFVKSTGSSD